MDNNLKKIADRLKAVDKTAIITHPDDDDDFGECSQLLPVILSDIIYTLF